VAETFNKDDVEFYLINTDKNAFPIVNFKFQVFDSFEQIKRDKTFDVCVMKFKDNNLERQKIAKALAKRILIIDELGNIEVVADVVVNSSVNSSWHRYTVLSDSRFLIGPEYFIVDQKIKTLKKEKFLLGKVRVLSNIIISMGGADRTKATVRICKALKDSNFTKTVVLGPLFDGEKELLETIGGNKTFIIKKNPPEFLSLLSKQDFLISAGGNTLWEAAFLGIPSVVLYEDRHEQEQGLKFEKQGFAKVAGSGAEFKEEELIESISNISKWFLPKSEIIDGRGAERINKAIKELINL
jgi:spore coat polysaccharide biosynthesis predicted glycosyltransferase SpsG